VNIMNNTIKNIDYDHDTFMAALGRQFQTAKQNNDDDTVLTIGAIALFWKHKKNIAYLNKSLTYARTRRGIRVNALRSFLTHFTGAVYDSNTNSYTKAGKMKTLPKEFHSLSTWVEWADNNGKGEPEFDEAKATKSAIAYLNKRREIARENNAPALVEHLTTAMLALEA